MKVSILKNPAELGCAAAKFVAERLNAAIADRGEARLLLSTGMSQFDTISSLIESGVDWSKVTMFHLDEYIGLPETHPASFRKYLKERFISKVNLKEAFLVDGTEENRGKLCVEIVKTPIDVALIGIGQNAHIAFNDPPANFATDEPYIIVELSDTCKAQQVGEGWFATLDDVPPRAVSMSPRQIIKARCIVSCVPHDVKAQAIKDMFENKVTNMIPATLLKTHPYFHLYLETESAALLSEETLKKVCG